MCKHAKQEHKQKVHCRCKMKKRIKLNCKNVEQNNYLAGNGKDEHIKTLET